jgi:hypothetical protein
MRWCPPRSSVCIDFPPELLVELRPRAETIETTGFLYGSRQDSELCIHGIRPEPSNGPERVGIFVSRLRGEVFLTESNLEIFENENALVALVVAGEKAGFFVREPDGSIQSVRSHEEFPVPSQIPAPSSRGKWGWAVVAAFALALLLPVFPQRPPQQPALQVSGEGKELHIVWRAGEHAILEIHDGEQRVAIPVSPDQSNATYARRTSTVEVSLIPLDGRSSHREIGRFVTSALPAEPVYSEFTDARAEVDRLRTQVDAKRAHADSLRKAIGQLLAERAIQQQ